jgi:hypothetical protein
MLLVIYQYKFAFDSSLMKLGTLAPVKQNPPKPQKPENNISLLDLAFLLVDFLNLFSFQTVGSPSIEGPPCLYNHFQIDAVFSLQNTVCSLCNTHLERS